MRVLIIVSASFGGILLFLIASASANTTFFARHYPWLLGLNALIAIALFVLIAWQIRQLWQEHRTQLFGSRLKLRLMLMFGMLAVLPGLLIYGVSVQFVTKSIDTWFDERVEKALESGLHLGRQALDSLHADLIEKARHMALEVGDPVEAQPRLALARLRERAGIQSVALYAANGLLLASATGDLSTPIEVQPPPEVLLRVRSGRPYGEITTLPDGELIVRAYAPILPSLLGGEMRILQLAQTVPSGLASNAERVQAVYRDYQELSLGRLGLTRIYAMTLTLAVLLALFTAIATAFLFARRLSAPLSILAEGTQAVAAGDFTPRQSVASRDELGVLIQSFNQMTNQLNDARRETERHRAELESARAYLESILGSLSAGVLVFDHAFLLRTVNPGAKSLLNEDIVDLLDQPLYDWPKHQTLGEGIFEAFAEYGRKEWQKQLEIERPGDLPQILHLRGADLPMETRDGFVVVIDDVTHLVAAQRSAAWGEVARRLAHEIKNPLTPIQLSAERLQLKLEGKLFGNDADMFKRATQTIINQVQAMKRMVNEFSDYARLPAPTLVSLDLNALILEVLELYESSHARMNTVLDSELPTVRGDISQIRQIIHNLLKNAEDAQENMEERMIDIRTSCVKGMAELAVADYGTGFPPEIMARVFEPYVTTKERGTGLGLPIVKKIIDEHRGQIFINNRQPRGAEVRIWLPLAKEKAIIE